MSRLFDILKSCFRRVFPRKLPCTILSWNPPIIASYWEDFCEERNAILATLPTKSLSFAFFQLGWEYENFGRAESAAKEVQQLQLLNPHFHPIFLTNTERERAIFISYGLRALFVQQNAFLDESRYAILSTKPSFDAIYIARITPFKRHYLASKLESLYLIGNYSLAEKEFALKTLANLPNAKWVRKVWGPRIKNEIAKACVGLCLSKEEGAMFVSAEYLLCGKPIVSTQSLGGREALFDPAYTYIVDENPEAILAGVKEAASKNLDPWHIRNETLKKIAQHRARFVTELQRIFDETGTNRSAYAEWSNIFLHKLGLRCRLNPFISFRRTLKIDKRF